MLSWLQHRIALRRLRRELGPALVKRYGREPSYTIAQVDATMAHLALDPSHARYAYAAFCARDDFDRYCRAAGADHNWVALRRRVKVRSSYGMAYAGYGSGFYDAGVGDDGSDRSCGGDDGGGGGDGE